MAAGVAAWEETHQEDAQMNPCTRGYERGNAARTRRTRSGVLMCGFSAFPDRPSRRQPEAGNRRAAPAMPLFHPAGLGAAILFMFCTHWRVIMVRRQAPGRHAGQFRQALDPMQRCFPPLMNRRRGNAQRRAYIGVSADLLDSLIECVISFHAP